MSRIDDPNRPEATAHLPGDEAMSPPQPSRASSVRSVFRRMLESNSYGRRFRAMYWRMRDDLDVNDGSLASPGFQALMVYRFGAWHRTLPRPLRIPCALIYRPLFVFCRNVYGIEIPASATIGRRLRISHQHGIVLHTRLVMGDDCTIRQNVTIGGVLGQQGAPTLGNRVDVAAGAVILGRVRIGDGARIGPNAVVTMNVPAGATAFAAPARIINVTAPARPPQRGTLVSE
jgi:serine O-acetyltransferase